MRRRTFLYLALGIVVALGVLVALLVGTNPRHLATQNLPDGSTVTLIKITTGTNQVHFEGSLLSRTADRILPTRWRRNLNLNKFQLPSEYPAHVFWFKITGPATFPPAGAGGFSFSARINDDGGGSYRNNSSVGRGARNSHISALSFKALPTGRPRLQLHLYRQFQLNTPGATGNTIEAITTFDVPNPAYVADAGWRAAPLPARFQEDGLDFTVKSFGQRHDREDSEPVNGSGPSNSLRTVLNARIGTVPGSSNTWHLRQFRIFNETGSLLVDHRDSDTRGEWTMTMDRSLVVSTNSLWKLEFLLTADSPSAGESLTLTNVPLTARGAVAPAPLSAQAGGFVLTITNLASTGIFDATLTPADPSRAFLCTEIRFPSSRGRSSPDTLKSTHEYYRGRIPGHTRNSNVNLTFIWPRKKIIEVIVRPDAAAPTKP